jgi:hypothetical protein
MYAKLEQVLRLAAKNISYSAELQEVVDFCRDDFNKSELETERAGDSLSFRDIHKHLKCLSNVVSEQSASAMRRLKTYLRTSMSQTRPNNVMVVHNHKHLTDSINHIKVLSSSFLPTDNRQQHFGKF